MGVFDLSEEHFEKVSNIAIPPPDGGLQYPYCWPSDYAENKKLWLSELQERRQNLTGLSPGNNIVVATCPGFTFSPSTGYTIADYNIQKESTLHLVLRLRGGGSSFEFTDMSSVRQIKWSTSAPAWRVAEPGLCYEGKISKNHYNMKELAQALTAEPINSKW